MILYEAIFFIIIRNKQNITKNLSENLRNENKNVSLSVK